MQLSSDSHFFVENLLSWFKETRRELPWRKTYDPYHVWISEIMLQQTQMERGVRYFTRWVARFPGVEDVAAASEDEILKYWEGLGYYARARNLHKAAKEIVERFSSVVPADYDILLTLPGIGPYTAAAIASIAGNQDVVVVDANVNRIISRLFDMSEPVKSGPAQKRIAGIGKKLLPKGKARQFNQALMDFGGLVCTPRNPSCSLCPVQSICESYQNGTVHKRPVVKQPPKTIFIVRHVAIIVHKGRVYMQKRKDSSVWGGMWEFPGGERVVSGPDEAIEIDLQFEVKKDAGLSIKVVEPIVMVRHQYTNHKILMQAHLCSLRDKKHVDPVLSGCSTYSWMTPQEMDEAACPSGVRKIIDHLRKDKPEMFSTAANEHLGS